MNRYATLLRFDLIPHVRECRGIARKGGARLVDFRCRQEDHARTQRVIRAGWFGLAFWLAGGSFLLGAAWGEGRLTAERAEYRQSNRNLYELLVNRECALLEVRLRLLNEVFPNETELERWGWTWQGEVGSWLEPGECR